MVQEDDKMFISLWISSIPPKVRMLVCVLANRYGIHLVRAFNIFYLVLVLPFIFIVKYFSWVYNSFLIIKVYILDFCLILLIIS